MAHTDPLQHCYLVSDHMLPAGHQPLIDDLRSIVPAGVDMYTFFDHTVGASTERLAGLVATRLYLGLWLLALRGHDRSRIGDSGMGGSVRWSTGTRQGVILLV